MQRLWTLLAICLPAFAQAQTNFDVRLIPDSLLKGANAVKRYEQTTFIVESLSKTIEKTKVAYTILNEKADGLALLHQDYDKMRSINTFDATLYDMFGKKVKSVKRSEVKDESAVSGGTIMADSRVKWFSFFHKQYPYTVEFELEVESKNTMFFTTWCPIGSSYTSVQQSSLLVQCPKDYELRYKLLSGSTEPVMGLAANNKTYKWEVKGMKAVPAEPYSDSWYSLVPTVMTTPQKFIVEGYEGDMSSWENFGHFRNKLNAGRDNLPENIKAEVRAIVAPLTTDREKTIALYKYLQQNTHYISVQLGIGGWQPFDATYVAKNKFGDCKALSNYMTALLKEAGILSYYSVIKAGPETNYRWFLPEFTSNNFNHIIVCVPNHGDTIWLECTSQTQAPGYMGSFTDNRYALLITPEGGKLVKTPKYTAEDNLQTRHINASVEESGDLKITASSSYRAQQQDALHSMLNRLSKEKVLEVLKSQLDIPNYELENYEYKEHMEKLPVVDERLLITAKNYAQVSGKRIFITPNIMTRVYTRPTADSHRLHSVRIDNEYRDIDTVVIAVPAGFAPESMPKETDIKTQFGRYHAKTELADGKIVYTRLMEKYSGIFPAAEYNDMVGFYEAMYKADRARVVLVKKE